MTFKVLFLIYVLKLYGESINYKCFIKQNISEDEIKSVLFINTIYVGYMLKSYKEPMHVI